MASTAWVLFVEQTGCSLGRMTAEGPAVSPLPLPPEPTADALARSIADGLNDSGYRGEGILLAVDSRDCLAANLRWDDAPSTRNRRAVLYELEAALPLAVEDLVIDYVLDGEEVFGVALPGERLAPLISALEARQVIVQSIVPVALLAAQARYSAATEVDRQTVVWQHHDQLEYVFIRHGRPAAWRQFPAEPKSLCRQLRWDALHQSAPLRVSTHHLASDVHDALVGLPEIDAWHNDDATLPESIVQIAPAILEGRLSPWIDLRRDELAATDRFRPLRRWIRAAWATAIVLCLAGIGGWTYRAQQYEALAAEHEEEAASLFRRALPGQAVPVGIRSRLESECSKLAGSSGQPDSLADQGSALTTIYNTLRSLPDDVRFRLCELRFERRRIALDGELRGHGDAELLIRGLRERGYTVQPPRTQQLATQAVAVRIMAEKPAASSTPRPR